MLDIATLQDEHDALLGFLYMCPVGLLRLTGSGDVEMMNPYAAQMLLPLTRAPALQNLFDATHSCAPELRDMVSRYSAPSGSICQQHRIYVSRNGPGPRVVACTLLKIDPDCMMAVLQDVTDQVEQERQLRKNEAMFAALVAGVKDFALFSLDSAGRIDSWNLFGQQQTGYTGAEIIGRDLDIFNVAGGERLEAASEQVQEAAREGWSVRERWCTRRDGSRFWCQIMVAANQEHQASIENHRPGDALIERTMLAGYAVVLRDITERSVTGAELRRLLTTDHLTGATNRARFFDLAEIEIMRRKRNGRPLSAIMIDIDHFKQVNDRFGHAGGDRLLLRLMALCRGQLRSRDVLARMGGEEFAILLPDTDVVEAERIAERIRCAVRSDVARPDVASGDAAQPDASCNATAEWPMSGVTISLGCATLTEAMEGIDDLLKAADGALYEAKRGGRDQVRVAAAVRVAATAIREAGTT